MKKVYLAGGISDTDRKKGQKRTAKKIRELGFEVYAAAENNSINDKTNDPTPLDIYNGDIERVKECDIFVVRISGGNEDGTLSEIGFIAGWNEGIREFNKMVSSFFHKKPIEIVAYTTNERLLAPDISDGIPSASFNALIKGMIDMWGVAIGDNGRKIGTRDQAMEYLKNRCIKND